MNSFAVAPHALLAMGRVDVSDKTKGQAAPQNNKAVMKVPQPRLGMAPVTGSFESKADRKFMKKEAKKAYTGLKMNKIQGGYNLEERGVAAGQDRIAGILRRSLVSWKKTAFGRLRGEFFPLEGGPLPDFSTTEPTAWVPLAEAGIVSTDVNGAVRMQFFPAPNDCWCVGVGSSVFGIPGVTPGCRGFTAFEKLEGTSVSDSMLEAVRCTGFRILVQAICNDFNNQGTVAVALAPHQNGIAGYPSTAELSTFPYRDQWSVKHLQGTSEGFVLLFASTQGSNGAYIREAFQDLYSGTGTLIPKSPYSPTIYLAIDGAAANTAVLRVTLEMGIEGTLETRSLVGGSNNAAQDPVLSNDASNALAAHPGVQQIAKESPTGDSFVSKALKFARREGLAAWDEVKPLVEDMGGLMEAAKKAGGYVADVAPFLAGLL